MTERLAPAPGPPGAASVPPRARRRGWRSWLIGIALGLAGLIVAALLALRHPSVSTGLARAVLARVHVIPRAVISVDDVRGDVLTRLDVRGLRVTRGDTLVASLDVLRARYRLASLLVGTLDVRDLDADGVMVTADIVDTTRSKPAPPTRKPPVTLAGILRGRFYSGPAIRVDRFAVRNARYGGHAGAPDSGWVLDRVAIQVRNFRLGRGFSFLLDSLVVRGRRARGTGRIELDAAATLEQGRFEARRLRFRGDSSVVDGNAVLSLDRKDALAEARVILAARPLALRDLAAFAPGLALEGIVLADVDVIGLRADQMSGTIGMASDHARWGTFEIGGTRLSATLTRGRADTRLSTEYERAHAELSGWVRPFDATPTYDVEARIDRLPERIPGATWWPSFAQRVPVAVSVRAEGSGFTRPAMNVAARARGDVGRIDLDGRLDLTHGFDATVRRLAFESVDVARIIGDTTAITVSGTLTASAEDATSSSRRLTAALDLGPSSYGDLHLTSGRVRARMNGAEIGVSLGIDADPGSLEIASLTGRWDEIGTFRLAGARFRDLDLQSITGQSSLASRLEGSLSGEVRGLRALASSGGATAALRGGRVSGRARVELVPSRFGDQEITRASLDLALAGGRVNVGGVIESSAGRLDLAARGRPFDAPPAYELSRARFTDVDLSGWTGSASLRSRLSGTLSGRGHSGAGPGSSGTWDASLDLDPSRFQNTHFEGGEVRGSWSEGHAQWTADLRTGGDTLATRGEMVVRDRVPDGHAELSIPFGFLAAMAGRDSLPARGTLVARGSFVGGAPSTIAAEGTVTGFGAVGNARLDSLLAGLHLRNGILELDTLIVRSNVGTGAGAGRVAVFDTTASSDLHVALQVNDVSPLRGLFGADTLAADTSRIDLRVRGVRGVRSFDVRASLRALAWSQVRLLGAEGSVQGDVDPSWRLTRAHAVGTLRRLRGIGLAVQQADVKVDLVGDRTDFDLTGRRDEKHDLRVVGHLSADSLGQHVALERVDAHADTIAWALSHPTRIDFRPDRLVVEGFELRSPTGRIDARGVIDRRGDQDFHLDMRNVGLDVLSVVLGRPDVTGTLSGALSLEGPATAPRGTGNVDLALYARHEAAGTLRSRLAWNGTRLDFDGRFTTPDQDSLAWNGSLPLAVSLAPADSEGAAKMRVVEGGVDVRLRAQHFPLRAFSPLLDPSSVGAMDGTLDIDLRLEGSSRAVVGNGNVQVSGGSVPLPGLGVIYRDIDLRAAFENDRLIVKRGHLASEKGQLDVTGDIRFVGVTRVEPRLHVDSRHFVFVQSPDLRAIASGAVDVTGTVPAPIVRGKVTIENSSFFLKPAEASAAEPGVTVRLTDADLRMMEENFGDVNEGKPNPGLALYDASDLDLNITLERNNWVRQRVRPKMSVSLAGDFRLKKAPHGEPQMFGRIEPIPNRGYVEQFARSFDIAGGEVLLNGPMKDHRIDIQAEYKPSSGTESDENDTVIKLDVQGSIEKMSLTLSSEPPMSEVEIVNYIATGHSAADKTSSSSSQQSSSLAKDIGMSQVTGFAEEAAQEAIGLDVLQVRFDALQGATLVAGRYIDPQLYVGFRQPLQYKSSSTPTSTDTQRTSVELEYAIYKWLVLNLQGETSKVRSFIRARHAY